MGRVISNEEFLNMLSAVLSEPGGKFPLKITGSSMVPFLADGRDTAILTACSGNYKKGDILLYKRENGAIILHRLIKIKDNSLWFAGDAQEYVEGPVQKNQVIAECREVIRKGENVKVSDPLWKTYSLLWIKLLKSRKKIMKAYSKL